jgi:hypothetical protein
LDLIDDGLVVYVNDHLAWHNRTSSFSSPNTSFSLNPYAHPGSNRIVLVLTDWCTQAELRGAKFVAGPGQQVAALQGKESHSASPRSPHPAPAPTEPETPLKPTVTLRPKTPLLPVLREAEGTDDWLRPRRDASNSSHSHTLLHLPLKEAWSVPYNIVDARVWGDTVLGLSKTIELQNLEAPDGSIQRRIVAEPKGILYALDLKTGQERWNYPDVTALGDASEDGRIAVMTTLEANKDDAGTETVRRRLTVLDARNGEELWHREGINWMAPLAVHQGILYLFDGKDQLLRFSLADGSVMPTTTAPLEGWSLPAFSEDQIFFADWRWLYALYLPDPQRGTKFYDGGYNPLVYGQYLATEGAAFGAKGFRRDGKWLRNTWSTAPNTGALHAWLPLGERGAALENGNALRDLATGEMLWQRESVTYPNGHPYLSPEGIALISSDRLGNYGPYDSPDVRNSYLAQQERIRLNLALPRMISAGTQIVMTEMRPGPDGIIDWSNERPTLAVRDGKTGDLLWESEELEGRPLAAVGGRLLVASHNALHCLQ